MLAGRYRRATALPALLVLLLVGGPGRDVLAADPPHLLLEKGLFQENTKGDLDAAITIYKQILADDKARRGYAAQAQLRLLACQVKKGDKAAAAVAFQELLENYPQQIRTMADAPSELLDAFNLVKDHYYKDVDREKLARVAIQAILKELDEMADYLPAAQLAVFEQEVTQKLAGVGLQIKLDESTKELRVVTPLADSPALAAGVKPGDIIVEINGKPIAELGENPILAATQALRGPVGEAVTMGVKRTGVAGVQSLRMVRAELQLRSVLGQQRDATGKWDYMIEPGIGYVRLTSAAVNSSAEMQLVLGALEASGMKGLVLDLRDNPGGMFQEAVAVADLFLEQGTIVTVQTREGQESKIATKDGTCSGFPMVVLVNGNTASAGELITAALQDHQRAVVVGERTFGRGLIQSIVPLGKGNAVKFPTGRFLRPSGKNLHRSSESKEADDWGVRPDDGLEVRLTPAETQVLLANRQARDVIGGDPPAPAPDPQLEKALAHLRQHVKK